MSADRSSTEVPELTLAVETLRRSMHDYRRPGATERARSLRVSLRVICLDARRQGASAAQLLIALKGVWSTLPEVQLMPRQEASELLAEVVHVCIEEYYRVEGHDAVEVPPTV